MFHQTIPQLLSISIIYMCTSTSATTEKNIKRSIETYPPYTCYKCFAGECNNPYNITCDVGLKCFTHTEIIDGMYLHREKGCHRIPFVALAHCNRGIARKRRNETNPVHTCCSGNFCNDDEFEIPNIPVPLIPSPAPIIKDEQMKENNFKELNLRSRNFEENVLTKGISLINIAIIMSTITASSALIMAFVFYVSTRRIASNIKLPYVLSKLHKPTANNTSDGVWTSGSGSGKPFLNQRSLSQDVSLTKCIGQGRYGEVWHGMLRGENVAVKKFSSVDVASWENEVSIYSNIALYHENVLGFKGSTICSRLGVTELWLVTSFHEQGSLYDYLLKNTVSHKQMIVFARSACSGLLHLHTEIFGSKGKLAIAHRDLKTRNILVTSHGTCVIADFGLAIVKSSESSSTSYPENYRVGTKRYMAPELLDESMKTNSFESFKRADMYAFGLMLWEVCSRCDTDGTDETFHLAFDDCAPNNPDFEDMKKIVCTELKRPRIPDRWSSDERLNAMAELMKHCWHKNPEVRYTACRVKKTLDKIHAQILELQSNVQIV